MRLIIMLLALVLLTPATAKAGPGQRAPDLKRQKIIRAALQAHGYPPGASWHQTQDIMRQIASERHWQTHYAPDARVLILLGLGNPNSDPQVILEPHNQLDGMPRRASKIQ
jgi:hypothetical protein